MGEEQAQAQDMVEDMVEEQDLEYSRQIFYMTIYIYEMNFLQA
jgi:hypothetical protein